MTRTIDPWFERSTFISYLLVWAKTGNTWNGKLCQNVKCSCTIKSFLILDIFGRIFAVWKYFFVTLTTEINVVLPIPVFEPIKIHDKTCINGWRRNFAFFASRSSKLRKCSSKKPTEQDLVSTLPNLDALRDDKGDAAAETGYKTAAAGITVRLNKKCVDTSLKDPSAPPTF